MKKIILYHIFVTVLVTLCNVKTKGQQQPPQTEIEFFKYQGDLSVLCQQDSINYDKCTKMFRLYYTIITKNNHGNIPFTYKIKIDINGYSSNFYYTDGSNLETGSVIIKNLGVDESVNIKGFIRFPSKKNPEKPDVNLKALITPSYHQGNKVFIIDKDNLPKNNIAECERELPFIAISPGPFDNMDVIEMPLNATLAGDMVFNPDQYNIPSKNVPWGIGCSDSVGLFYYNNLYGIKFEKAYCYDSGKPVYYMKFDNKYITSDGLSSNRIVLRDATAGQETNRQWVFVKSNLGFGFHIYNAAWGANRRLKIIWVENNSCRFNAIVLAPPDNNLDTQTFSFDN